MTQEQRLQEMEDKIEEVLQIQQKTNNKLDEVLKAIQGNQMSGDEGLAKRVKMLEEKEEQRSVEGAKNGVYIKIITWLAGIIVALIIAYMFDQAYNRPQQVTAPTNQIK